MRLRFVPGFRALNVLTHHFFKLSTHGHAVRAVVGRELHLDGMSSGNSEGFTGSFVVIDKVTASLHRHEGAVVLVRAIEFGHSVRRHSENDLRPQRARAGGISTNRNRNQIAEP